MKLIAHRGASLVRQENSVESLAYASELGAFAVECDLRQTKDGVYVIYHDDTLERLTGAGIRVADVTYPEMKARLEKKGYQLLSFTELEKTYEGSAPILLHIKFDQISGSLARLLAQSPLSLICGVQSALAAEKMSEAFPPDKILGFLPEESQLEAFASNGTGIIRLWEHWLDRITPQAVKKRHSVSVWIMACDEKGNMNGSKASLERAASLDADGMLLNDIELGIRWINQAKSR